MCHLIINKNLDPPCKTTSNTHLFGEKKKKEREGNDAYRSRFNQHTISPSLPPRNVRRFIVSIQNDRTWKRSEGASGTSRQTERERDVRTNPYRFYTSKGNRDFAGARWSTGLMEKRRGGSIRCGMLPETTNIACRLFPRGCNCATHWTVPAAAHALHQRNESFRRKSRIASLRSMTELVSISLSLSSSNDPNLSRLGNLFSTFQRGKEAFGRKVAFEKLIFEIRCVWTRLHALEHGLVGFVLWKIIDFADYLLRVRSFL